MSNWIIRRAKDKDAAYSIYASRVVDLAAVSECIADDIKKSQIWVAERDNQIIAGLVLIPKPDHIVLANVAVSPSATGSGLHRAFTDLAETEATQLSIAKLQPNAHVKFPENVGLCHHLG